MCHFSNICNFIIVCGLCYVANLNFSHERRLVFLYYTVLPHVHCSYQWRLRVELAASSFDLRDLCFLIISVLNYHLYFTGLDFVCRAFSCVGPSEAPYRMRWKDTLGFNRISNSLLIPIRSCFIYIFRLGLLIPCF